MGKITVQYHLNEEGQKADLKAGGNGHTKRVIDASDTALRDKIIELGDVYADGNVCLYVECGPYVVLGRRPELREQFYNASHSYRTVDETIVRVAHPEGQKQQGFSAPQDLPSLVAVAESLAERRAAAASQYAQLKAELEQEVEGEYEAARDASFEDMRRSNEETERKRAEKVAREKAAREEMEAWIREHGSERLQLILKRGLLDESMNVYREERLAQEYPGWVFDNDWLNGQVDHREIRNPSLETLQWAESVNADYPDAELKFAAYDDEEDVDPDDPIREPIMVDTFLNRTVVLRKA